MFNKTNREDYWDAIRGIAICFVVLSHCCSPKIIFPAKNLSCLWYCIEVNLISTAVAVFFFMSGYWAVRSYLHSENARVFICKRVKRLFIPYLLYSILYICFRMLLRETFSIQKIVSILVLGQAATPLYYLPVLIIYSLLTPYLINIERRCLVWSSCILATICLSIAGYMVCKGIPIAWYYLRYSPIWLPFYTWGMLWGKQDKQTFASLDTNTQQSSRNSKFSRISMYMTLIILFLF